MSELETTSGLIRPCTRVYLLLIALTVVTWGIGKAGLAGLAPSLLVLGFALLKGQLIGDWFMGLRFVSGFWRWVIVLWLLVPGMLIGLTFLMSHRS